MHQRRLPSVYFLYVGLTVLQPTLFVLVGALRHLNTHGIWFMVVLLLALAYRSRIGWALLVVINAIPLMAIGSITVGGQVLWSHVTAMVLTGVALESTLFSAAMRQHVVGARKRVDMPVPSL